MRWIADPAKPPSALFRRVHLPPPLRRLPGRWRIHSARMVSLHTAKRVSFSSFHEKLPLSVGLIRVYTLRHGEEFLGEKRENRGRYLRRRAPAQTSPFGWHLMSVRPPWPIPQRS